MFQRFTEWKAIKRRNTDNVIAVLKDTDRVTKQRYINRLAQFEDLGYTPQELKDILYYYLKDRESKGCKL